MAESKGPSRGYSWEPFQKSNTYSLVHGAESPAVIEAKAGEVRDTIRDLAPWLDRPEYLPAVARWLRAEARALLLHAHIEKVAAEKGTGTVPVRQWEQATAADRLAARLGSDLGLDPIGRARIAATATTAELGQATLAELGSQGKAIRERREAALQGNTDATD